MRYTKEQTDEMVRKMKNHEMTIYDIPEDDDEVYDTFKAGKSNFTFQFGSQLSRGILSRMKNLDSVYDLASVTALGRPGPMKEIDHFVRLANGEPTKEDLQHKMPEQFEPYFRNSYGLFIFQEQFIEVCRHVAGFNWAEADEARKAVGKKNLAFIEAIRERFFAGCMKAGVAEKDLQEFWTGLLDFASYSFNLSHAYCYAKLGYVTCWFLTHYPAEYLASIMNKFEKDKDKIQEAISCCKDRGIKVTVPNVLKSNMGFTATSNNSISYGLGSIKGMGKACEVVIERRRNRRIESVKDFFDLFDNSDISEKKMKTLVQAGAFDELCKKDKIIQKRSTFLFNFENIYQTYRPQKKGKKKNKVSERQSDMFDFLGGDKRDEQLVVRHINDKTVDVNYTSFILDMLDQEMSLLGDYVSSDPLNYVDCPDYDPNWKEKFFEKRKNVFEQQKELIKQGKVKEAKEKNSNEDIAIKCIIMSIRKVITKKGDEMCFMTCRIPGEQIDLVVFPKTYQKIKNNIQKGAMFSGKMKVDKAFTTRFDDDEQTKYSYILQTANFARTEIKIDEI